MHDILAFDNSSYLREQTAAIIDRVRRFGDKLYLEFGGKLLFDYHAARVLPGYDPNVKMRLLAKLRDELGVTVVSATHDLKMLKRSDRILWIEDGRIVKAAAPDEIDFTAAEFH